jgi:hypothetical protein
MKRILQTKVLQVRRDAKYTHTFRRSVITRFDDQNRREKDTASTSPSLTQHVGPKAGLPKIPRGRSIRRWVVGLISSILLLIIAVVYYTYYWLTEAPKQVFRSLFHAIDNTNTETYFPRSQGAILRTYLTEQPREVIFVTGPLNCGKTSLIRSTLLSNSSVLYINLRGTNIQTPVNFIGVLDFAFCIDMFKEKAEETKKGWDLLHKGVIGYIMSQNIATAATMMILEVGDKINQYLTPGKSPTDKMTLILDSVESILNLRKNNPHLKLDLPVIVLDEMEQLRTLVDTQEGRDLLRIFLSRLNKWSKDEHLAHVIFASSAGHFYKTLVLEVLSTPLYSRQIHVDYLNKKETESYMRAKGFTDTSEIDDVFKMTRGCFKYVSEYTIKGNLSDTTTHTFEAMKADREGMQLGWVASWFYTQKKYWNPAIYDKVMEMLSTHPDGRVPYEVLVDSVPKVHVDSMIENRILCLMTNGADKINHGFYISCSDPLTLTVWKDMKQKMKQGK